MKLFLLLALLLKINAEPSKLDKNLVSGMKITALAYNYKPMFFSTQLPNGNFSFEGWGYDYSKWIADYFNMTIKYVVVDKDVMLKLGTFLGLMSEMEKKHADIVPIVFPVSLEDFERLSFSQPLILHEVRMLQLYPNEQSRLTAPIRPFTSTVWILFLFSTSAFIGAMSFFARLDDYPGRRSSVWDTVYDQLVYAATIITLQGNSLPYTVRSHFRITVTAWLLAMVVFIYAYTGLLTAMLTVPKLEPIINTLEELAASPRFRITKEVYEGMMTQQLLTATHGTYKILGDQIRKDHNLLFTDNFQMIENVLYHDCVFPTAADLLNYIANEDLKATGKCRMTVSTKDLPFMYTFHVGFAKGSRLAPLVDRYFSPVMESSGLRRHLMLTHFSPVERCRVNDKQDQVTKPLSFGNFSGVFAVLLIGLGISIITFLLELGLPFIMDK